MKRMFSFLMALVLTFSLVSMTDFTVLAATQEEAPVQKAADAVIMDEVSVSINEPTLGMYFDDLGDDVEVTSGHAEVTDIVVYDALTGDEQPLSHFNAGRHYFIVYTIVPDEGYEFADGISLDVDTKYTYNWYCERNIVEFSLYFREGGQAVTGLDITVPELVPGASASDCKPTAPASCAIEWSTWRDLNSYDVVQTFEENGRYMLEMDIAPNHGYYFSDNMQLTINGEEAQWYGAVDGYHFYIEKPFSLVENEQTIDRVEMLVDGIAVGTELEDLVITLPEDAPYEIDYVYMYDDAWEDAYILEDGKQYYLFVLLQPKVGYIFGEDLLVSGSANSYSVYSYGTVLELVVPISFQKEEIYYLELNGVPETIAKGDAEIPEVGVVAGAASISDMFWVNEDGEIAEEFIAGNIYKLAVKVTADNGYRFPTDPYEMQIETGGRYIDNMLAIDGENQVTVYFYYYDMLPQIEEFYVELPIPQVGMNANDLMPEEYSAGVPYEFTVYNYEQDSIITNGVIEENSTYQVVIGFTADGFRFSDALDVRYNSEEFPYQVHMSCSPTSMAIYYEFTTCEPIEQAEISATIPEPGMSVEDCTVYIPDGVDYTIDRWLWRQDDSGYPLEGEFEEGKIYVLNVYLTPTGDRVFDTNATEILLNGEEVGWHNYSGKTISVYYYLDLTVPEAVQIEYVNLGELPEKIQPGKATVPAVEIDSEGVSVTDVKWVDSDKNKTVTKFVDGKAYYLAVTLKTEEGYVFSSDPYVEHWYGYAREIERVSDTEIVAYIRYSLEPEVGDVTITPGNWSVGMDIEDITVNVDGNAQIEYIAIYDTDTYDDVVSGKIEANRNYCITVSFIAAEGYRFGDNSGFDFIGDYNTDWWGGEGYRVLEIYFSTKQKITEASVTLQGVEIGNTPADVSAIVPGGAPYNVSIEWYNVTDGWMPMDSDEAFEDMHKYQAGIILSAKDNYAFAREITLILDGEELTVHTAGVGEYATHWEYYSYLRPIDRVDLPAVPSSIKKGQALSTEFAMSDDAPYTLTAQWGIYGEGLVDKASENGSYVLYFQLEAKEGYEFAEDVAVYVDGKAVKNFMPSGGTDLSLYFVYNVGLKEIDRIDLTTATIAAGNKAGEITAPKDAKFTLEAFGWFGNFDNNVFEADSIDVFETGIYVYFSAELSAKDGYAFAPDVEIYINGMKAGVVRYMSMGTYAMYAMELGKVDDLEQVRTKKLDTPVVTVEGGILTWAAVADADGYEIYRSTKKSSGFKKIDTVTVTEYFDQDAAAGKTYYYKVKAIYNANSKFNSSDSKVVSVDYKLAAPAISAEINLDTGKTVITWEKVAGAKSYDVYRATEVDGKYTKLGNTKNLSYTDSKAAVGAEYYYKVVAVASSSKYNSDYSNIYMSYAILGRPDVDIEIDEASGKPELSWKKVSGAVGYRILRKLNGAAEYEILAEIIERSFADITAPLDSSCEYRVVALHENEYLHSAYSKVVEATVTFGRPAVKGSINGEGQPVLTWNAIDGALKYEVLRSTKSNKGFALIATATEGTAYTDETATPGTTYYYQVVAVGENTKSKASSAVKLTGTCAAPVVDIRTDPETGKPVISWEKVSGAKSYDVYYATSANGKYKKLGNTKNLTYTDTKIAIGATRYYKVVAVGSKKTYNSPMSNMVAGMGFCAAPDVKTRVDTATGKPSLSWSKVSGAVSYRIFRIISTEGGDFVEIANISKTTFIDTTAPIDTKCIYMVQAMHKVEGLSSAFSAPLEVTSGMAQPKLDTRLNGDGQPQLSWMPVEGAIKYEIYRSTKSSTKGFTLYTTVEGNAFTDTDVAAGKTYYYKVVAIGAVGKSAEMSAVKLTATCAVPVASADLDITSGRPVITWEKISGAKKYEVWRATSADGKYKKVGTTSKTEYVDTGASVGGTYYYKVKAIGSKKSYNSDLSAATEGITAFLAQPKVTVKTDSKGMPVVSWKKVSGASKYYVLYVDVSDYLYDENVDEATLQEYIENNLQYVEVSKKKTSVTLTDAQLGRLYMVYVIAAYKNEAFSSAMSEPQIIDRCCVAPKIKVSMVEGYNGATWNHVEGAEFYIVYRSTKKSSGYVELGSVEGNGFIDGSAVKGKTYYYKVAACTMHSEDTFITVSADSNVIKIKTKK